MQVAATLLLLVATSALAAPVFRSFATSADGNRLEYTDSTGATSTAPKLRDQVGYSQPRISSNGQFFGWLALYPNCCTSYPIPLVLVVMDKDRHLYEFQGAQATFGWCFQPSSSAVAYRRALLHGLTPDLFELRRVQDGKLLKAFEVPVQESGQSQPTINLPSWAKCAAD